VAEEAVVDVDAVIVVVVVVVVDEVTGTKFTPSSFAKYCNLLPSKCVNVSLLKS
jgi:hypothetical protein